MGDKLQNFDSSVGEAANSDVELQFGDFNYGNPSSKGKYKQVPSADVPANWENPTPSAPNSQQSHAFYSLDYYMQFFNVDTDDVMKRMGRSFMPWKNDFFEFLQSNPDLYGPFWIATTVVFVMFVTGNISGSVLASIKEQEYTADFQMLSLAATSVYSYIFLGSLIVWGCCKYYKIEITLLNLVCLYGYGMTIFIPVSIICVAPQSAVKWVFTMVAFLMSGTFLAWNLWPIAKIANKGVGLILTAAVIVAHLGLSLLFKFVFFTYSNVETGN